MESKDLERFWAKVNKDGPIHPIHGQCWEWIGAKNRGHGVLQFSGDNRCLLYAHRLIWEHSVGFIPDGLCVLHKCDNRACIRLDHLFLGTKGDNNTDRNTKGRSATGERNGKSKLTDEEVRAIRNDNRQYKEIAKDYGMYFGNIGKIKRKELWGHVKEND